MLEFYGEMPGESMRAYVVTLDERVAGIIGIAHYQHGSKLFSEYRPELRPYLRSMTVLRAIKAVMALVEQHRGFVYAVPTHDGEGLRILRRLGFTDCGEYCVWES